MDEPERIKEFYEESITNLMKACNDIDLLDLIMKLLQQSNATA